MSFTFRPAKRENSSVLVALAGHTGTGKTMSAIRLGLGLAGPGGRIAFIDTESGRGTHYSDQFQYDYADMRPPFSPACYQDAIEAAEQAKYDVIIIDSFSHEWSGDGGCCDMQAETLERMANGDARRMERLSAPAWKDAKIAHKKLISRLLQTRASVIFALRAEPKVKFVKVRGEDGKERTVIEDMGFQPICEKSFMFEMTCSFMINEKHLPVPIKLPERFRPFFSLDKPITEESGQRLAAWAKGDPLPAPPEPLSDPLSQERAAWLKKITVKADGLSLSAEERRLLWVKHCGTSKPAEAAPELMADLYAELEKR